MKNLFLSIFLFWFGQVNAQCVKLYVKEKLKTGRTMDLEFTEGDYIEICEDDNEVNVYPYKFYVYDKAFGEGTWVYELSAYEGAPHIMSLHVNPTTQRFATIRQGQAPIYSYYTEAEMTAKWARQNEQKRIANQRLAEQSKIQELARIEEERIANQRLAEQSKIQELARIEEEKRLNEANRQADLLLSKGIKLLLVKNKTSDAYEQYQKMTNKSELILKEIDQKKAINENKVKKFLASNNIDSSIFYYKLNPPEKNIKLLIQDKLSELNKAEQEYVIDDKFLKFVKDSLLNKLTVLTSVDNILHINNKGNCTINDLAGNAKLKFQLPENLILRKKYDEFEYTLNTKSKFNFFIDTNKYFVKGLILDSWYETHIPHGTVVFYYAKKKKKEFILSNKVKSADAASKIPARNYDVLTKLTYFRYEKMEFWGRPIINIPAFLNRIPLGDMEASGALYMKCSLNFKNELVEF